MVILSESYLFNRSKGGIWYLLNSKVGSNRPKFSMSLLERLSVSESSSFVSSIMESTNIETLISELAMKSKKSEDEIRRMVNAKTEKFQKIIMVRLLHSN